MMYRLLDISLIICFSVSIVFVGVESMSEIPPPKNINFKWETPFGLYLTWDKPEDLETECKVNYTINRSLSQKCSFDFKDEKRVQSNKILLNVSNVNGLCVSVTTNCLNRSSPPKIITIPPPPVLLVKNFSFSFSFKDSHNQLSCIWRPAVNVKDLSFYFWHERIDSPIRCIPEEMSRMEGCVINDTSLKDIIRHIFFLFNGTYNGIVVNNTFMGGPPKEYVRLKKPLLTILRTGDTLVFKTNASDLDESCNECYDYNYTVSKECNKRVYTFQLTSKSTYDQPYDPSCKYRAQVQIIYSKFYGKGFSDVSDEVEYGENSDPNLSALLALIIIPLVVSCCLILFLVLLRRKKDVLFPKIPDPSLFFKEMLISNVSIPENLRPDSAVNRLYVPIEETVEHKISLEQETLFVRNTTNVP